MGSMSSTATDRHAQSDGHGDAIGGSAVDVDDPITMPELERCFCSSDLGRAVTVASQSGGSIPPDPGPDRLPQQGRGLVTIAGAGQTGVASDVRRAP
jgi:hypothetical protein